MPPGMHFDMMSSQSNEHAGSGWLASNGGNSPYSVNAPYIIGKPQRSVTDFTQRRANFPEAEQIIYS